MAAESKKDDVGDSVTSKDTEVKTTKKKKGVFSRIWDSVFRSHGNDFEKRLQYITKEEATVLNRITKRSHSWRRTTRHLIIFSVFFEVIAVGYAIMTTRSLHLNWKMRALRVLPMFLLPALSFITYSALRSFTKMRDRKDHNTLERLRAERLEKINELKEKTNYYITQQLIQRYDPDPAAKAAAATVLASKLGADSGLKVRVGDDPIPNVPTGKSHDVEVARTAGLRNRKQVKNTEHGLMHHQSEGGGGGEMVNHNHDRFIEGENMSEQQDPLVVEHHPQMGLNPRDGGWIARLAALLVGEDPTQSYALICGNCHMHNGLARKEDFPYITYYCPHCNALNRPKRQPGAPVSGSSSPTLTSLANAIVDNAQVAPIMSEDKPPSPVVGSTVDKVTSPVGDSTANKVSLSTSPTAVADTDADAASAPGETSES